MIIPKIDYLFFGVNVENYQDYIESLAPDLFCAKERAKENASNNISEKVTIDINGFCFEVRSNGANGYAFILNNDMYQVKLAQYRSTNLEFYPIMVIIHSPCLWAYSPETAYLNIIDWVQLTFGKVISSKASRVDLCCHNNLLQSNTLSIDNFKGDFKSGNVRLNNRKTCGIEFGTRNSKIFCRIYNKTLEVDTKRNKLWFYQIWAENGYVSGEVWNIEFELKRDFFKSFALESVEDVFDSLKSIWETCTQKWLVMIDRDRTRTENCTLSSDWIQISHSFDTYSNNPLIKRHEQLEKDALALIPAWTGYCTSISSRFGCADITKALNIMKLYGQKYLNNSNQTFESKIDEKIDLLGNRKRGDKDAESSIHS